MLTVYVDMDDVLCNFSKARSEYILKNGTDIKYPQSQYDFFRQLEPVEGAIEGFNFLCNNTDAYIASAPSVYNPMSYTEKAMWIKDYFGLEIQKKLILITNKSLLCGDYLIDDKIDTNFQEQFSGKLITFGSGNWKTWNDIINYFKVIGFDERKPLGIQPSG